MERFVRIIDNGGEHLTLYYGREGSWLDHYLENFHHKVVKEFDVSHLPSWHLFDVLNTLVEDAYHKADLKYDCTHMEYIDGFSCTMRKDALFHFLDGLDRIHMTGQEVYNYQASHRMPAVA